MSICPSGDSYLELRPGVWQSVVFVGAFGAFPVAGPAGLYMRRLAACVSLGKKGISFSTTWPLLRCRNEIDRKSISLSLERGSVGQVRPLRTRFWGGAGGTASGKPSLVALYFCGACYCRSMPCGKACNGAVCSVTMARGLFCACVPVPDKKGSTEINNAKHA